MKILLCTLILLHISGLVLSAQAPADSLIRTEIDRQIWRPFIRSFSQYQAEEFNQLHTSDVLRASPGGIVRGEAYFQQNRAGFQKGRESGHTRRIAFTFEQRVHQPDIAYEVGYYRITSLNPKGETRTFYGQFHVVLKQVEGVWKIAQDWDMGKIGDRAVSEADFLRHADKGLYE